ncbi:MAG: CBS domain-containing protein, partial [Nitrososphaerota archaeon]|nr:CBS domain-containing protein [Nitrososphaerota archaeon]
MVITDDRGRISFAKGTSSGESNLKLRNCWHFFVRHTSTTEPLDPIRTVLKIMAHRGFRHLPVVRRSKQAGEKELLGIVSAQDLINFMDAVSGRIEARQEENALISKLDNYVSSIMSDHPVTITSDESMLDAIRIMSEKNVGALPIIKSEAATNPKLLGIITLRDLISLLAAYAPFGIRSEDI